MTARKPAPKKAAVKRPAKKATAAKKPAVKRAPRKRGAPRRQFGTRGQRIWNAHHEHVDGERGLALLEEACRIADRLDRLDAILRGDVSTWCTFEIDARSGVYTLLVTSALIEARQQANTLRQLVASLPMKGSGEPGDGEDWADGL